MREKQRTLKAPVSLSGVGLHTGEKVNLTICPAKDNHGYKFQRVDVEGEPIINADTESVVDTKRGTTLSKGGVKVCTTEHILAALYGLQIDNALIKIDGPEVPILDGSARHFVEALLSVGFEEQKTDRTYFELKENIAFEDTDKGIEMLAVPADEFRLTVMVDYNSPALGTQHATMYNLREFEKDIASCRTFVFLKEIEKLADQNLIKGGDLDNAIVLVEREHVTQDELKKLARKLGRNENFEVKVKGIGVLNNSELKYQNEPARHKLLDIVGDLALIGMPIRGHILAARPGHSGNVSFAKILKDKIKEERKKAPKFDLDKAPIYNIHDIAKMLPHRYPFLLVDKIMEMNEYSIIGVKNVTYNEPFFEGHFPGNPIMPGVLQIEAMAQVGGIFTLSGVDKPEDYTTYLLKIDHVRFKRKVEPGDTLVFKLELLTPIRRGIVHMKGEAYANGYVVTEAEMMAQIVKEK